MRTINPLVLLVLLVTQSASTQAADLNGAWTVDASACGDVFTKDNNKLAFKQDADLHAGESWWKSTHVAQGVEPREAAAG
jgi:hypothetical protein